MSDDRMYYKDKIPSLERIFGTENIVLEPDALVVDHRRYPLVEDVIILSEPDQYTDFVRMKLRLGSQETGEATGSAAGLSRSSAFAEEIQFSFGEEWKTYSEIMAEHEAEFQQYFDLVDLVDLRDLRVCDLGCGNGRWSYYLKGTCREILLVDFSDAIFIARRNLSDVSNCLFFMCDLKVLPFEADFVDFLFCIGVLHHLPTPCLNEVRNLKRFAPALLVYLYYSLDNRPVYFRLLLKMVTWLRLCVCRVRSPAFRNLFARAVTFSVYLPLVFLGRALNPLGLSRYVPLFEAYGKRGVRRIEQDVYDRFFTGIEQRISRQEILGLQDTFRRVKISDGLPYYHFLCER